MPATLTASASICPSNHQRHALIMLSPLDSLLDLTIIDSAFYSSVINLDDGGDGLEVSQQRGKREMIMLRGAIKNTRLSVVPSK